MHYKTTVLSPVGELTLACDGDNLIGLWIKGQRYHDAAILDTMAEKDDLPIFNATRTWLAKYFSGGKPAISDLPLAPSGGSFRKVVWYILCSVPYGEVITYRDIAKKMAVNMRKGCVSSQAVGGAVCHNPISIIIPCHRIVGVNGSLTSYTGGVDIKIKLLGLEGADMSRILVHARESVHKV